MKNILTLAFVALTILVSCGKKDLPDNPAEQTKNPFVGIWKIVSETDNGNDLLNVCRKNDSYTFNEDNTYVSIHNNISGGECAIEEGNGTYSFTENTIKIINTKTGSEETAKFEIKGTNLTIINGTYKAVYEKFQNPLIGTWDIQTQTVNGTLNKLSDCQKKEMLVFTDRTINRIESEEKNGLCVSLGDDIATYVISGNKLIEISEGEKEVFTFEVKENILTMNLEEKDNNTVITTIVTYKKR
ncbi:lipocalin family protein [Capnocytophaga sp.]|uniref:lipocalin family protein n=1 Tax=Capnocytophaga sp. TaxID=44737 RepID=UPI0026DA78BF|nr:lipocalin family protein [Capnocytophaga sp.]MDO5106480.1 lipocalin family protein [Capnocytophaga sp.]